MEIHRRVEELSTKIMNGKMLKEVYSYDGFSFWWRLKEMFFYNDIKKINKFNLYYHIYIRYPFRIIKDLFFGVLFKLFYRTRKNLNAPLIYSLIRNKEKCLKEVHTELVEQNIPFNYIVYFPGVPSKKDMENAKGCIFLEQFLDFTIIMEELKIKKQLRSTYKDLAKEFQYLLPDHSLEKLELISRYYIEVDIPETYRLFAMGDKLIRELNPTSSLVNHETGKHTYPIMAISNRKGIKTLSVQSGAYPNKIGCQYIYDTRTMSSKKEDLMNFAIPDITLTYGEKDNKFMKEINANYGSKLVAIGNPHYDYIYKKMNIIDVDKLRLGYGLPADKKILLWPTQTHSAETSEEENELKSQIVFGALDKLRDTHQLVIKLHQGEDQKAPLYKKFNKKYKNLAIIFDKKKNILDLILASDFVIITNSTVGIEAILANKPLLILSNNPKIDNSYFKEAGFDFLVRSEGDLLKYLSGGDNFIEEFKKSRENYVKYGYANFGNATKKFVEFIKQL